MSDVNTQSPLTNFSRREFFVDISRNRPFVVQSGSGREVALEILTETELKKLQDFASRQLRRSFYKEQDNVYEHRATLHFLSSWIEKRASTSLEVQDRKARPRRRNQRTPSSTKAA
ncbi:MAG: hypothetical protein O7C39_04160 [Bacteroidetes bacterium]|nr:hypothetical protein [Bacteroidota bacterium]